MEYELAVLNTIVFMCAVTAVAYVTTVLILYTRMSHSGVFVLSLLFLAVACFLLAEKEAAYLFPTVCLHALIHISKHRLDE